MIKQEWKNILKNHWIQIVLVALILIPSIYTVVFLGSMWDPYGNSGDLPVAVVNKDKAVEYNDKKLDVGDQLVKKLKDNDSLDFHFVNSKEANKGLKDGDYYMVITIPSNFSKNATTLLDKNPKKMVLNYTTNPGTNYVASKMDDSAIAKIKAEVSASVTKTYAETIFTSIGTMSDGFAEASDGTQQLSDGMTQLEDGNKTISDNLKVLASSSLTFKDGKIVEAVCDEDNEALNQIFDTDEGARYVGEFSIGVNPVIRYPMGDILFDEKIIGSIHFTPGTAYKDAYNGNDSSIHWDMVLIQREDFGGGNIYFDDVLIRENGLFVLDELKHLNK